MKAITIAIMLLIANQGFCQMQQTDIDSLKSLYKKNVVGYSKTIFKNPVLRETMVIFYTVNGEMQDTTVWARVIDKEPEAIIPTVPPLSPKPKEPAYALCVYKDNVLLGTMNKGTFTKLKPDEYDSHAVPKWMRPFLDNDQLIGEYLVTIWGHYFNGIIK
jgi:hypothetical protein